MPAAMPGRPVPPLPIPTAGSPRFYQLRHGGAAKGGSITRVAEVMTSGLTVIQDHLMIGEAAKKMKALDADRLLVLDGYVAVGFETIL